ncbi:MAG: DUF349 domain-containing protein [Nonlabens sp.]|uniref:DUF349 domain-containing protein n=1 Tax=Nonlabens sp. TaxID=1888209 RepID=UPI003EF54562
MDTNDNLPKEADGNLENVNNTDQNQQDMPQKDMNTEPTAPVEETKATPEETETAADSATEIAEETAPEATEVVEEAKEPLVETPTETEALAAKTDNDDEDDHAEDVEAQTLPDTDYNTLEMPALVASLRQLIQDFPINTIKTHVDDIKKSFESKDEEAEKEAREEFKKANPVSEDPEAPVADFVYDNELTKEFHQLHSLYRKQRGEFQRQQRKEQEDNLEKRKQIIESIKNLIDEEENIGTTFKKFNNLQQEWKNTGKIPHDAYNIVWNDYRLHTQNFYDYIDLSKELRDKDFERNLDFHNKIIARAEELGNEPDIHKALRELQELHRMWKEDAGPVAKEHRDPIWDKFSAATKVIHDKRQSYYEERDKMAEKNEMIKQNIIAEIQKITAAGAKNHKGWQDRLEEINALKELFTQTGPATRSNNNSLWEQFRVVGREFNQAKNAFYKDLKKDQQDNLDKKMKLIEIAEQHLESDDFNGSLPVMKRIQSEWKEIGHVPRKVSDKIWKRFQAACNGFFDKKNAQKKEENAEETANFDAKMKVYDALKEMLPQDDQEAMKADVQKHMADWAQIGRVPYSKRHIQDKFDKLLEAKLKAAGMSAVAAEMMKYQSKLSSLESGDERDFKNERFYLRKRRDEIQDELRQLENNMQFINAKDDKNPFVVQLKKNTAALNKELDVIKEKQKQLNVLERQINKAAEEEEAANALEAENAEEESSEPTE